MNQVLVLNQDYSPITICSVQRAFLLLYLNKAELINEVKERKLRTVSQSFPFPSIIRTIKYVNIPYKGVVLTRHNVFKRDHFTCQYCGTNRDLTLDHLIPRSKGGKSNWTNLVTACKSCNAKKGDFSPEEVGMNLKKQPVKPSYFMFLRASSIDREDWFPYLEPKAYAS
jgi:5-methylcytosine-specific restriction endonuclease McrA